MRHQFRWHRRVPRLPWSHRHPSIKCQTRQPRPKNYSNICGCRIRGYRAYCRMLRSFYRTHPKQTPSSELPSTRKENSINKSKIYYHLTQSSQGILHYLFSWRIKDWTPLSFHKWEFSIAPTRVPPRLCVQHCRNGGLCRKTLKTGAIHHTDAVWGGNF